MVDLSGEHKFYLIDYTLKFNPSKPELNAAMDFMGQLEVRNVKFQNVNLEYVRTNELVAPDSLLAYHFQNINPDFWYGWSSSVSFPSEGRRRTSVNVLEALIKGESPGS